MRCRITLALALLTLFATAGPARATYIPYLNRAGFTATFSELPIDMYEEANVGASVPLAGRLIDRTPPSEDRPLDVYAWFMVPADMPGYGDSNSAWDLALNPIIAASSNYSASDIVPVSYTGPGGVYDLAPNYFAGKPSDSTPVASAQPVVGGNSLGGGNGYGGGYGSGFGLFGNNFGNLFGNNFGGGGGSGGGSGQPFTTTKKNKKTNPPPPTTPPDENTTDTASGGTTSGSGAAVAAASGGATLQTNALSSTTTDVSPTDSDGPLFSASDANTGTPAGVRPFNAYYLNALSTSQLNIGPANGGFPAFDTVPNPEPTTIAVFGLMGLIGMGYVRRRKMDVA